MDPSEKLNSLLDNNIGDEKLLSFVKYCIEQHREKYFSIPVSISFHGHEAGTEGSNALHIIRCLEIAADLRPLLSAPPYSIDYDQLMSAIALHDMGKLMCYAKEGEIWKYFGINSSSHPGVGAELVERLAYQSSIQVPQILSAIRAHYGPYGNTEPASPLEWALHLIEMLETKCKAE